MRKFEDWKKALLGGQVAFGLVLALAPWLVGFAAETPAAWTAWITGAVMVLVAFAGFAGYAFAASWVNLAAGVWAIVAPWLVGFAAIAGAMWSHVVLGILVAIAAAIELWQECQPGKTAHA
ncbi:SPW repeat protein [Elioraea sp.]|uniref:SPW repeat protein n=1 Tax=Elioraea sp. TaxID=2185103 RepID=UPI003F72A8CD